MHPGEVTKQPFISTAAEAIARFISETPKTHTTIAIIAFASQLFFAALAPPLITISISALAGRIAVKALSHYNMDFASLLKKRAFGVESQFRKLRLVLVVACVAAGLIWMPAGIVSGIAAGLYLGLLASVEHEIERREKVLSMPEESRQQRLKKMSLA